MAQTEPTKPRLWHLTVSTFRGFAPQAEHYYATLKTIDLEVTINCILTPARARALTAKGGDFTYRAGEATNRFDTRDDAITAAVKVWRQKADDGDALVRGDHVTAEPQEPLAGPTEFMATATRLYDVMAKLEDGDDRRDIWREFPEQMRSLTNEWDVLRDTFAKRDYSQPYKPDEGYVRAEEDGWVAVTEDEVYSNPEVHGDLVTPDGEGGDPPDHPWVGVAGHPDDDECTHIDADGWQCEQPRSEHAEALDGD